MKAFSVPFLHHWYHNFFVIKMLFTSILRFMSSAYLLLAVQLNVGCFRDGPHVLDPTLPVIPLSALPFVVSSTLCHCSHYCLCRPWCLPVPLLVFLPFFVSTSWLSARDFHLFYAFYFIHYLSALLIGYLLTNVEYRCMVAIDVHYD